VLFWGKQLVFFLGGGNWGLNSGLHTWKAGILPLEPCSQSGKATSFDCVSVLFKNH
jgi:hypothetical protein